MTTPAIMDAIVVIILVVAVGYGAKRGLLESLAGLVIVFMALAGAGIAAGTFAEPVTEAVTPLIEERVTEKVREAVEEQTETFDWSLFEADGADPGLIGEVLVLLGLDGEVRDGASDSRPENPSLNEPSLAILLRMLHSPGKQRRHGEREAREEGWWCSHQGRSRSNAAVGIDSL